MIKRAIPILIFIAVIYSLLSFTHRVPAYVPGKLAVKTIIVDAGHGGKDNGAHGDYSYEKNVCLDIAMQLGQKLEEAFPNVKILYTRNSDTYPEIRARADFANKNGGDLFISIHANAAPAIRHTKFKGYRTETYYRKKGKKRVKATHRVPKYDVYYTPNPMNGTETYIWAADRTEAKGEFIGERMSEEIYDSSEYTPDVNDPEFRAKSLLWTKKYFDKSLLLASLVEEEFGDAGRASRGVKQRNWKGIWVLQATAMPSILVETGFLTYKSEEDYLNSSKGQEEIADNVFKAVKRYLTLTNGKQNGDDTNSLNDVRPKKPAPPNTKK